MVQGTGQREGGDAQSPAGVQPKGRLEQSTSLQHERQAQALESRVKRKQFEVLLSDSPQRKAGEVTTRIFKKLQGTALKCKMMNFPFLETSKLLGHILALPKFLGQKPEL